MEQSFSLTLGRNKFDGKFNKFKVDNFYDYEHKSLMQQNKLKVQSLRKISHWECSIALLAAANPIERTQNNVTNVSSSLSLSDGFGR